MKKMDSVLLKIFVYALPVVLALTIVAGAQAARMSGQVPQTTAINSVCGLVIGGYMALTLSLSFRLVMSADLREAVLKRLTFIKERDEREVMLTGQATKAVFLSSIAVLLVFFCLSCFQISVYRVAPENAVDGKTGVLSLGVRFTVLDQAAPAASDIVKAQDIFSYTTLPVSNAALILFLIAWQVVAFNVVMRRLVNAQGSCCAVGQ